jgi:hypothetical protein
MTFAMKTPMASFSFFRLGAAAMLGLSLAGCVSHDASSTVSERPMPTMRPRTNVQKPKVPEQEIVATALRAALNNDVPTALRTLELAGEPAERASAAGKLVRALAEQNPAMAAAVALGLPSSPTRSSAIEAAALAWVQRDSEAALRWSLDLSDPSTAHVARRTVIGALVRGTNPKSTLDRITALPAGETRDHATGLAAAAWARHDFEGANAWLRQQSDDAFRQRLASIMAFETAQVSPPNAITLSEMLPPGRDRWIIFSEIGETWVAIDRNAALNWANRLPEKEAREAAIAGIETGSGLGSTRRGTVAPRPTGSFRGGARVANAIESAIDPAEFKLWLASQTRPMSRDEAIQEFVRQRGMLDAGPVGTWLATLPPSEPGRRSALETYFDQTLRTSPANAANWLRSLPISDRRDEMIEKTVRELKITDPNAAAALAREMNLPPGRQEELLRR